MLYYMLKVGISAVVIVLVSEIAKRSSLFGALIASIPLTSLLAFIWMHIEKTDVNTIAQLSTSIFWLVIPSLVLFILLPILLNRGIHFWLSLALASSGTVVAYGIMVVVLGRFNIKV